MPVCPTCRENFASDIATCPRDGSSLITTVEIAQASTLPEMPAAPPAAPSGSFDSLIGATLANRYTIIRRIGEGGMGAVYEARHAVIGKRVAVKVLLEKYLSKSDFVARLLQEARLASAIGHENIVDVVDFGTTDDGRSFVVMEFLDGESLAQLLMREAPLPVERSLRLARQVASALSAAHAKGIVHRDIKPENVYIVRRGEADFVKVVDFGISKAVRQGQGEQGEESIASLHLTHTGLLLGTPLYMSPEQARGAEDLDQRVDIWSAGVLLYECLTGEVPFRANNYLGIISQVLNHVPVPPSQLRPELGIPEAVEAVVMHAMEKDRSRRTQTMSDLERELERLLAGDQNVGTTTLEAAAVVVPQRAGVARWHLGLAAGLALVGGAVLVVSRPGVGPTPASAGSATEAAMIGPAGQGTAPAPAPRGMLAAPTSAPPPAAIPVPTAAAPAASPAETTGASGVAHSPSDPPKRRRGASRLVRQAGVAAGSAPAVAPDKALPTDPASDSAKRARGVLPASSREGYATPSP